MNYPIEQCKTCERFNHQTGEFRNKLRCLFQCEEYKQALAKKSIAYNRAVSGDEFDTEELYEHGKKVYGSGLKP